MEITTNNVPRDVVYGYELSQEERDQFDYLDWVAIDAGNESAEFFRYKYQIHALDQFMRFTSPDSAPGWDGYRADSFFSGLVARYVENGERVIVGYYIA